MDFVSGTIELTGRLAEDPKGALQIVASSPALATPLVKKCSLDTGTRSAEGTWLVPFSLGSHSGMMATRAIPREVMPDELSMKVSYSPTGYVENIEAESDLIVPVKVGDLTLELRMEPGEAPQSRPTSRPTSRPVVGGN